MSMMKALPLFLFLFGLSAGMECDSDRIACRNSDRCIPHSFMCDYDDDCNDESDEDADLCNVLRNTGCVKGEAMCSRNGDTFCIDINSYCFMENPPCEGDLDRRICMMLEARVLYELDNFVWQEPTLENNLNKSKQMGENFLADIPYTLQHHNCPPMYTMVNGQCLSLFHIGKMSWSEAREFCKILGGDLATFSDVTQYAAVVQHIQRHELFATFWIGGMMENAEQGWTWIDGSPMPTGTPYWATIYQDSCVDRNLAVANSEDVCFRYRQAPMDGEKGQCARLCYERYFYMVDDDCMKKLSPLCEYKGVEQYAFNDIEMEEK